MKRQQNRNTIPISTCLRPLGSCSIGVPSSAEPRSAASHVLRFVVAAAAVRAGPSGLETHPNPPENEAPKAEAELKVQKNADRKRQKETEVS